MSGVSELTGQRSEFRHHPGSAHLDLRFQILQDNFSRLFVESEIAVSWQTSDPGFHLSNQLLPGSTKQGQKPLIKTKLSPLVPNKVQN